MTYENLFVFLVGVKNENCAEMNDDAMVGDIMVHYDDAMVGDIMVHYDELTNSSQYDMI